LNTKAQSGRREQEERQMLAIIAVIIFAVAFIIRVTATATDAVFAPASLVILGLICMALHLAGLGAGWRVRR
jgi:uncharacterized membrane-anchored protein